MTVRDLVPGARVTYRGELLVVDHHIEGGGVSWLHFADDEDHTACFPSSWMVQAGEIMDRRRSEAEPATAVLRDAAVGGPQHASRRGDGLGRDLSRRSPEGATPGVLVHEVIDRPRQIEDVLDLALTKGLAVLLAFGGIAWTLGDFPPFQGPLAFAGAVALWLIGRRRAEG